MPSSFFFDSALLPTGWAENVRVRIRDGVIEQVTVGTPPAAGDYREALAVPGLPNVHSHAFQRAMAGLTETRGLEGTDNFWSWREVMYRFLARLDADDVEAIAAYAYAEMLAAGFTSVAEFHYLHRAPDGTHYRNPAELALRHVAAADATGIGQTLLPVFYATSDFGGVPPTAGQRRFITDLDTFARVVDEVRMQTNGTSGRHFGIAPHSLRAVTPDQLGSLERLHPEAPFHIHAAEQAKEVERCLEWSGLRPVEWLLRNAGVDRRWCLVHATHLTPAETVELAKSGAVAGLCPITEANLGDGIFPAPAYLQAEGRFGIGTDSNVSLDAAGELRQLEYAQRLHTRNRNVLASHEYPSTARRIFASALSGGAQALGQRVGAIAAGFRADWLVLDRAHPDLDSRSGDAILDTWIFSCGRSVIHKVIAGGKVVAENGRHLGQDRVESRYRRVLSRLMQSSPAVRL